MSTTTLIAVTAGQIDGRATQLADARLLHEFLGVGKDFTTWIRLRIRQYGFEQNRDYLLTQTGEQLPFRHEVALGLSADPRHGQGTRHGRTHAQRARGTALLHRL